MDGKEFAEKLRGGQRLYGTLLTCPSPHWFRALAEARMDCAFLDTEHVPQGWQALGWMCHACRAGGMVPIVRIPRADPFEACRALDLGARAIVAAYIESAEEVKLLRGAVKLRPLKGRKLQEILAGNRPLEGEMVDYVRKYNENNVLLVNIESVPALEALDEILAVPDLDGLLIGPHDLSCSLGVPEQYDHPLFEEAMSRIIAQGRARGVGVGFHNLPKMEQEVKWGKAGLNLFLHLADMTLFRKALVADLARLRGGLGDAVASETAGHINI